MPVGGGHPGAWDAALPTARTPSIPKRGVAPPRHGLRAGARWGIFDSAATEVSGAEHPGPPSRLDGSRPSRLAADAHTQAAASGAVGSASVHQRARLLVQLDDGPPVAKDLAAPQTSLDPSTFVADPICLGP